MKKLILAIVVVLTVSAVTFDIFNTHHLSEFCKTQYEKAVEEYVSQEYNKESAAVRLFVSVDDYANSDKMIEKYQEDKPGYFWFEMGDLLWQ